MKFLVDANVIVYAVTPGPYREPCLGLLEAIAEGAAEGFCSVAVVEEVWHLELSGQVPGLEGQARRAATTFFPLLGITHQTLDRALALETSAIGANDRLHVATCIEHDLPAIVTADDGFDEVAEVERIDPLDERALAALGG